MMYGSRNTINITNSHYWVCDGVRESHYSTLYFVEYRIEGSGHYSYTDLGHPTGDSPRESGWSTSTVYHMNWGWGGSGDGWYVGANSPNGNFQHHRMNFYVYPQNP
jgi:hypothetical protein